MRHLGFLIAAYGVASVLIGLELIALRLRARRLRDDLDLGGRDDGDNA